jgi:hypothetical protein
METKICSKCKEEKETCRFEKNRNVCKHCRKTYINEWLVKNKDSKKQYDKNYRDKNFEKEIQRRKKYFLNHKNEIYKRHKSKLKNDPILKISVSMRSRLNIFLKSKGIRKTNKTFDIVGCSPEFLKEYIENKFTEGMSWDLMGNHIHIDHKIPLSSAKTEEEVYKLCHYTNLQPLWAEDNLSKGSKIL